MKVCTRCGQGFSSCVCEQFHPNVEATGTSGKKAGHMSVLINDSVLAKVWKDIEAEYVRSIAKHPVYPEDSLRRSAITMEELLEAAVELQRTSLHVGRLGSEEKRRGLDDLRKELIHAGAMVVKQLAAMYKEMEAAGA